MKNLLQKSLVLLILLGSIFVLGGCGGSSSAGAGGPSADSIKKLIDGDIDTVSTAMSELEAKMSTATGQAAADLATDANSLKNKLQSAEDSFDYDIENGYLTEDERKDYEKTIDEMKAKLDTDIADLTSKAGEFASTIKTDLTATPIYTKDELDALINEDETTLTNFEAGISGASGEALSTIRNLVHDRLETIEKAIDDLDKMVADGTITEDEKADYEKALKKLRRGYEEVEESAGSDDKAA